MTQENNLKNNEKFDLKSKKTIIAIASVALVLIVALCIALAIGNRSDENSNQNPLVLNGTYVLALEVGRSQYVFNEDGTGECSYSTEAGEVNEKFEYTISGSGESKNISFYWLDSGKRDTHPYSVGKRNGVEMIIINEVEYFKK